MNEIEVNGKNMDAIKIRNLTKSYGKSRGIDDISLTIQKGQIYGLIGQNGAGKTTLIKSLLNLLHLDSGKIQIFGQDHTKETLKEEIAVVLDGMFFPEIMRVSDVNLVLKKIHSQWDEELFYNLLEKFAIPKNSAIRTLSKGMQKKLEIAASLAKRPRLLILDEPTSGLDPIVRNEVLDLFLEFIQDEEHTILLSTHITSDLEHVADHIIFLHEGKILLEDSRDELLENYGIVKCSSKDLECIDPQDIERVQKSKYHCEVLVKNRKVFMKKHQNLVVDKATLEEIMLLYIKGEIL